jgi:hypothetical protein
LAARKQAKASSSRLASSCAGCARGGDQVIGSVCRGVKLNSWIAVTGAAPGFMHGTR